MTRLPDFVGVCLGLRSGNERYTGRDLTDLEPEPTDLCPVGTVTNYHKLGSLMHQKCICT